MNPRRSQNIIFVPLVGFFALSLFFSGCAPAVVSRIGSPLPPKPEGCSLDYVEEASQLSGPYRDIGMISLKNCQDPQRAPCSVWMRRAACELGGDAVYPVDEPVLGEERGGDVTVRVMVVSYAGSLGPSARDDAVARSRPCDPPCPAGQSCLYGQCRPARGCGAPSSDDEELGMCYD